MMTKKLTQAVFQGLSPEYRWAAVDIDGRCYAFGVKPIVIDGTQWVSKKMARSSRHIGSDYDATNWQNSLIERTVSEENQAEIERLQNELKAKNNHAMNWRREIINPSMAHMGAALVALRNGDPDTAQQYLETWLDAGGVCYERYTSHEVFFKRFHTDFMCDHSDKEACLAEIAEFNRRMTEDQEQDDE